MKNGQIVKAKSITSYFEPTRLPDEVYPRRAKLNTRYVTAGINYNLSVWRRHGLILIQFVDRRGKLRTLWYRSKDEFNEEWEEL